MERVKRKLKSERGASILLALLFFMISMVAGASILMAASSNAGRVRSNRREQQAYLALSSAVKLVADDLAKAEYCGRFTYEESKDDTTEVMTHIYTQTEGSYSSGLSGLLLKDFDAIFYDYMNDARTFMEGTNVHTFIPKLDAGPFIPLGSTDDFRRHEWTVTPDASSLSGFSVKMTLKVYSDYRIDIKAELTAVPAEYRDFETGDEYVMNAELTPTANPPVIDKNAAYVNGSADNSTPPMSWKIGWVTGENEEGS